MAFEAEVNLEMEAKGNKQSLTVPGDIGNKEIHLILVVIDDGTLSLTSYTRAIIRGE